MSLKSFHIFFIVISILFCLGFAIWEYSGFEHEQMTGQAVAAVVAIIAGLGLTLYLINVVKKFRKMRSI